MTATIQVIGLIIIGLLLVALAYRRSRAWDRRGKSLAEKRRRAALNVAHLIARLGPEEMPEIPNAPRVRRELARWLETEQRADARHILQAAIEQIDRRERAA